MKKKVLIIGGNKGIGLECICLFLENNYKVIVVVRDYKNFEFNNNDDVDKIEYDVFNIKGIVDLVNKIGCVDILVNNVGIMNFIFYDNYLVEKMNKIMDINFYVFIEFIKEVLKLMVEVGGGRIVNIVLIVG